ncbi:MAG: class I SAM-dependent methyltransferase [Patescibacteria group bacterium]
MLDHSELQWKEKFSQAARAGKLSVVLDKNPEDYFFYFVEYFRVPPLSENSRISVLDVGCGTGEVARWLGEKGFDVWAVDYLAEMIAIARQRTSQSNSNVHFEVADIYHLPFPSEKFDIVLCLGVLQTVNQPKKALVQLSRVLKPGGILVIRTLNSLSLSSLFLRNIQRYNPYEIMKILEQMQFHSMSLKGVYVFPRPFRFIAKVILRFKLFAILNFLFFPLFLFFSHSFYLQARKTR